MNTDSQSGRCRIARYRYARLWFFRACVLAIPLVLLCGCANVKPWERDIIASYTMQVVQDPEEESYEQHMHRALTQGLISAPAGGSGCGCEQ